MVDLFSKYPKDKAAIIMAAFALFYCWNENSI